MDHWKGARFNGRRKRFKYHAFKMASPQIIHRRWMYNVSCSQDGAAVETSSATFEWFPAT
jgi:hypothetical protein